MTLQQLEYIVALDIDRHFVSAAKRCNVAQPTLSMMIKKLEAELDVEIFDRAKHPIEPTAIGARIIEQSKKALREANKVVEIVENETNSLGGKLRVGVIPTLSTYIVPGFIHHFNESYSNVELAFSELNTATSISALRNDEIDMFIAATPLEQDDFFEIPIYYEKFVAYFSANSSDIDIPLSATNMASTNLWVLEEGHCLRDQLFNFCINKSTYNQTFEAGSIETLIKIIDANGGYSVIPELHLPFLTSDQRSRTREIMDPPAVREISIIIRKDFIKERLINAVADTLKKLIPEHMLDNRLKRFAIRL